MAHGEGRGGAGRAEHYMRGRDRYMERGQRIEKESLSPGCLQAVMEGGEIVTKSKAEYCERLAGDFHQSVVGYP
ncbi:hypothetical protein EYC84_011031 [Monilinia fructicola]|uniref:Uncharacterized protein n=1 Tax=Monilinia fructicola TaxID=38448 RepID=A0A5M9JBQ6_MONFR|nr:hypothetical protein EYC84_011031 [Monilinia fructicola]